MLFSLGALMNVFDYREEGTSSLSAKKCSKDKKCSIFMETFEFCKKRSKVENMANVLH